MDRLKIKKPWHKYFTATELALMFFGTATFYLIATLLYYELAQFLLYG